MDQHEVVGLPCSWAGWATGKIGPLPPACGSIESRYRQPAGSVFDVDVRPRAARISDEVGARVDAAVARSGHKRLLILVFLREMTPTGACGALHLGGDPLLVFGEALRQVADRLGGSPGRANGCSRGW